MDIFQWLTDTTVGKCVFTMLVSMVPIIELRGGLPFGVALGLPYYLAFPAAVVGNIIPAPFIIVYIRRIFQWMRRRIPRLNGMVDRLEHKAHLKGRRSPGINTWVCGCSWPSPCLAPGRGPALSWRPFWGCACAGPCRR